MSPLCGRTAPYHKPNFGGNQCAFFVKGIACANRLCPKENLTWRRRVYSREAAEIGNPDRRLRSLALALARTPPPTTRDNAHPHDSDNVRCGDHDPPLRQCGRRRAKCADRARTGPEYTAASLGVVTTLAQAGGRDSVCRGPVFNDKNSRLPTKGVRPDK